VNHSPEYVGGNALERGAAPVLHPLDGCRMGGLRRLVRAYICARAVGLQLRCRFVKLLSKFGADPFFAFF
jgi:hypothetical protein